MIRIMVVFAVMIIGLFLADNQGDPNTDILAKLKNSRVQQGLILAGIVIWVCMTVGLNFVLMMDRNYKNRLQTEYIRKIEILKEHQKLIKLKK